MFPTARWKAYVEALAERGAEADCPPKIIYHIYHAQKLWFTRDEENEYLEASREHLERSDVLLQECAEKISALEETLANTPKPSEALDWSALTLADLL